MIAVFSSSEVARMVLPTFELIRQSGRLDAFIIAVWIVSLFGKIP